MCKTRGTGSVQEVEWWLVGCPQKPKSPNFGTQLTPVVFIGYMSHLTILRAPEYAPKYAKYAYFGARNMVKWGVPEKILQNAVQTHWS